MWREGKKGQVVFIFIDPLRDFRLKRKGLWGIMKGKRKTKRGPREKSERRSHQSENGPEKKIKKNKKKRANGKERACSPHGAAEGKKKGEAVNGTGKGAGPQKKLHQMKTQKKAQKIRAEKTPEKGEVRKSTKNRGKIEEKRQGEKRKGKKLKACPDRCEDGGELNRQKLGKSRR